MKNKLTKLGALLFVLVALLMDTGDVSAQTSGADKAWIPPGNFQMGNCMSTNEGSSSELPLRTVYVNAFYMDKTEVSKALWDEVYQWAVTNGYTFDNPGSWFTNNSTTYLGGPPNRSRGTNHPVHTISWYDTVKWCNARSQKEARIPAYYTSEMQTNVYRTGRSNIQNNWVKWSSGYRLPTEAEWEKAARGGASGRRFPWADADTITHSRANYQSRINEVYDVSPTRGFNPAFPSGGYRSIPATSPVGYFAGNGYGLHDMAGNVWEWCWDWYGVYATGSQTNPLGATSGSDRILRGGSWYHNSPSCRNSYRFSRFPSGVGIGSPSWYFYGFGFRTVLPSAIPFATEAVLNTPSTQEVYSCSITRQAGKSNGVFVIHGWQPARKPVDIAWVDNMTNLLQNYVTSQGLNNWQVGAHKWAEKAHTPFPDSALYNGEKEGVNLGNCLVNQGWTNHIHFICHSAGSAVAQAATLIIKSANINTLVHITFLDPYVGFGYGGKEKYGLVADWSDCYLAWDLGTFDGLARRTFSELDNACNVDLTQLSTNKIPLGRYTSTTNGIIVECVDTRASHRWPVVFYMNTIMNTQVGSLGFGFPLSKEGGNWNYALANYSTYTDPTRVLGTPDAPCSLVHDLSVPVYPSWLMDFIQNPTVTSTTGSVENNGMCLVLSATGASQSNSPNGPKLNGLDSSSTPAWLAGVVLVVTNKINSVSIDAWFTSTNGAQGVLSALWNTNTVGTVDERVVLPGLQHYTFFFSETVTNGTYTLAFRLDSFTSVMSSITVSNIALGFVGIPDSFSLSVTGRDTNGLVLLKLTGPAGFDYTVEVSTNLIDWQAMAFLENTTGEVSFVDRQSTNSTARFYRAVGY